MKKIRIEIRSENFNNEFTADILNDGKYRYIASDNLCDLLKEITEITLKLADEKNET
jgi:hypothetical protein